MPPTTAPGRGVGSVSGGGSGGDAVGAGARSAVPTGGSGGSNAANRTSRPVPLRRPTPSTSSSMRPKAAPQSATATSRSQNGGQPSSSSSSSLLPSIPAPSFPPRSAFDQIPVDQAFVHARLLQLARHYLQSGDKSDETTSCDLQSASLYGRLALQLDPTSLPARRILATTLLLGAQPFPFGPSDIHSSSLSLTPNNTVPPSSASISGAHAAIELLKDGTEEVFMDVGCARIFARACCIVGKSQEGKEAMAWTLRRQLEERGQSSAKGSQGEEDSLPDMPPPPLDWLKSSEDTFVYNELASLAAKSNQFEEAEAGYRKAKSLDCWNWTAWAGLCDVGCDEDVSAMFPAQRHHPNVFYPDQLKSRLLSRGFDRDAVRRTIEELDKKDESYYASNEALPEEDKEQVMGTQGSQKGGPVRQAPSLARPAGSTAGASLVGNAESAFSRPGTRNEMGSVAAAGTKRVRTATGGSTQSVTAPRVGAGAHGKSNGSTGVGASDGHTNKRPAVAGVRSTGPTATVARTNGTLGAARTNEQRPNSSASASSRGVSEKGAIKPRRSARVNVTDEPQRTAVGGRGPVGVGSQVRRATSRPAGPPASATPSEADGAAARRMMAPTRSTTGDATTTGKTLSSVMQTASFEAARMAAIWTAVDRQVMELLQTLAKAYSAVKNFQSKAALILLRRKGDLGSGERAELRRELGRDVSLDSFTGLEECHRNSVDVQCLIARAYHNLSRYHLAEKHFLHARRLSPSLDAHMDIFSLTLYHLQREVQLSRLAKELTQSDCHSCISHMAKGNTFALQREHSLALQSFQRACLAAPTCAYAHTLAGYEALELGFKDKSVKYFRQAINVDRRHWNAFAGLGRIYFEDNRLSSAGYYFGRAIAIHKTNPVLWDVFGGVLCGQGKLEKAEAAFEQAIELDPALAMAHIKLAEVLLLQGELQPEKRAKAHDHLLEAVKHAPEEAHVHLMLAHTYMDKGNGSFARIDQGSKGRLATHIPLPSELQQIGASGPSGASSSARAIGNSQAPSAYQAEIARHLCAAVDLNPRYVRYVKAMGEGAKAALRGIVSRFLMDGHMGPDGSTLLMDSSALTEGQLMDSVVDLDGDQVLEDQAAMTEELGSDEGPDADQYDEQGMLDDDYHEDVSSQIIEDMMDASAEDHFDEHDGQASRFLHPPTQSESDVSMSF